MVEVMMESWGFYEIDDLVMLMMFEFWRISARSDSSRTFRSESAAGCDGLIVDDGSPSPPR